MEGEGRRRDAQRLRDAAESVKEPAEKQVEAIESPVVLETVRGVGVARTNGRIVLCADHDGDEFHQLYLLDPDRPWPERITDASVQDALARLTQGHASPAIQAASPRRSFTRT